MTKAQKKNAQKRQKRKEKRSQERGFEIEEVIEGLEQATITEDNTPVQPDTSSPDEIQPSDRDNLKRLRALRKKLNQTEELERRIASGEIPKPDKDQLRKIAGKKNLLEELEAMQQAKERLISLGIVQN